MRYRSVGVGIQLIKSDYKSVKLLLASKMLVREYLALEINKKIILADDSHVEYYSVVDKSGLNSFTGAAIRVFFGPLGHTTAKAIVGDKSFSDCEYKCVFIKFKDGKRILLKVREGFMHLIKSSNKRRKKTMDEKDARWVQNILESNDKNKANKVTKEELVDVDDTNSNNDEYYDDTF